jgi:hypothetical protein
MFFLTLNPENLTPAAEASSDGAALISVLLTSIY